MDKQTFSLDDVTRVAEAAAKLGRLEGKRAFQALWWRSVLKDGGSMKWLMSHPAYFHPIVDEDGVGGALSKAQGEEIIRSVFDEAL